MWNKAWSSSPKLDICAAVLPNVLSTHFKMSSVGADSSFPFMSESSELDNCCVTCDSFFVCGRVLQGGAAKGGDRS